MEIIHVDPFDVPGEREAEHPAFEYVIHNLVPKAAGMLCNVALYEIPPGKSNYPYHWHFRRDESFYIISGTGILQSPDGEHTVTAGDFLFFPSGESGAHKLTNNSDSQALVYLDFDTRDDLDVAVYPDSGKIGIWADGIDQVHETRRQVDYYDGE